MNSNIALIGLGAIGAPIAHKLFQTYGSRFGVVLSGERREDFEANDVRINSEPFTPSVFSSKEEADDNIELLILCIKNYDLKSSLPDVQRIVGKNTVILPLQNGIAAFRFYREQFPDNIVIEGFVQGPNTEINGYEYVYSNPGALHIGTSTEAWKDTALHVYGLLKNAGIDITFEENIKKRVWKKWMLNVAGNSVTALTGADYSLFKIYRDLQIICEKAMQEFLTVAHAENVDLTEKDIQDTMDYYISYLGGKKTSMLVDVLNERKTENDYLAGTILQIAAQHGIECPIISTLYYLMEVKEEVYMEKKGVIAMKSIFTEGVEYSDALRVHMNDIVGKMESKEFAEKINKEHMTDELQAHLQYVTENSEYYKHLKKDDLKLTDFPVMNKTLLNENYDDILIHSFNRIKTHKMHTSGSTGIPFTVVQDLAKRERHLADLKYFGALAGYADHDPMCYLRAKPTATPAQQERDNIWQLDITNLSARNLTDYYHVMVEKKCTALIAYPSTLETAVTYWAKHFKNDSCIRTIISTSETLTDEVRDKLHAFFGETVGIYARYSNTEQGILGQEYGESGVYRLNWASYYFEILKLESDEPAENGELGRIVITDIYNKAFPMIRYDTGDVGIMKVFAEDELPVITDLFGRRMDLIYDVNGEVVSPFLLCRTMRLTRGIEQWQFIQEDKTNYTLKITTNDGSRPTLDKEMEDFHKTLGEGSHVVIEYVQEIPVLNSLKRKLIVSNLK